MLRSPHRSALLLSFAALACTSESGHAPAAPSGAAPRITTHLRVSLAQLGHDTLSDSARITAIIAHPDGGDALPFRFDDPGRHVTAGLGILRGADEPQLLWPDSVTETWWSAPHTLAFTTATGHGVQVVVDVRDSTLDVVRRAAEQVPPPPAAATVASDSAALRRAAAFVDSATSAPGASGAPAALRYRVGAMQPAPGGTLRAFYVIATDAGGRRLNPAWYVLDTATRGVARIDQIVGPAEEMPEDAAAWSDDTHFVYARGREIWEATVAPASSPRAP